MNITLLCGNGLDLALGLRTSYVNFLSWWCHQYDSQEKCKELCCAIYDLKQALLQRRLNGARLWSDLEFSLGAINYRQFPCLKGRENACVSAVASSWTLLGSCLAQYLKGIQGSFCVPSDFVQESRKIIMSCLANSALSKRSGAGSVDHVKVSVVTLNYTDTLEKLLGYNVAGVEKVVVNDKTVDVEIGPIIHAHGDLQGQICFGLDNMNQFMGTSLNAIEYEQLKLQLSKKFSLNENVVRRTKALLGEADVIMTYGVSWGETDRSWWCVLLEMMMKGAVICDCQYFDDLDLLGYYKLEDGLRSLSVRKILSAMLGCDAATGCVLANEIGRRVYVPSIEGRFIGGVNITAGDYLGLNAICKLLMPEESTHK